MPTLHLGANTHLDPVWLWDRHEGFNQGISTCRTMLDLLDEDPDFTFVRGEAAIYEHIERFDPKTFARIGTYVAAGRWEIVGRTYIQPDTNLPATETMARHFLRSGRCRWLRLQPPQPLAIAAGIACLLVGSSLRCQKTHLPRADRLVRDGAR